MLVTRARLATLGDDPRLIEDGALLIEDGRVAPLGTTAELIERFGGTERWDAGGQLVHKLAQQDPWAMPGDLVFRLAYAHNAGLARVFWPELRLGERPLAGQLIWSSSTIDPRRLSPRRICPGTFSSALRFLW